MNASDDRELREHFRALRDEDAASARPFSGALRGLKWSSSTRPSRLIPVAVLATAAVVTAVLLVRFPRGADPSVEAAIAQAKSLSSWTAPTDDWLILSGLEIPNAVPSLSLSSVTLPEASPLATAPGETR
jgi:hypothetical protein